MAQSEKERLDALFKLAEDAHRYGSIESHFSDEEVAVAQERIKNKERLQHQEKCKGKMVRRVIRINPSEGFVTESPTCEKCGCIYLIHDPNDNFPIVGEKEFWKAEKNWQKMLRTPFSI